MIKDIIIYLRAAQTTSGFPPTAVWHYFFFEGLAFLPSWRKADPATDLTIFDLEVFSSFPASLPTRFEVAIVLLPQMTCVVSVAVPGSASTRRGFLQPNYARENGREFNGPAGERNS